MIAEHIGALLVERGVLGELGVDAFVNFQPAEPAALVTLYDAPAPVAPESSAYAIDQVGLQVLVRNRDDRAAMELAWQIHREIVGYAGTPATGAPYVTGVSIQTSPASIGRGEHGAAEWSAYYVVRFTSSGDAHRA